MKISGDAGTVYSRSLITLAGLAITLLVFCVASSSAWGDTTEEVPGQPYPASALTEVEDATESNSGFLSQLIDSEIAGKLPHTDLTRDEAVELAEGVFGDLLAASAGPFANLKVEQFLSDSAALVSPSSLEGPGITVGGGDVVGEQPENTEGPLLLDATLPLRIENESGGESVVDLDLERSEGELQAANPLIEVRIPEELGEGVAIPSGNLDLETSESAAERSPSILGGNIAFYPNVANDTDFIVATTPTGIETFTQIRSANAPQTQTLQLDLDDGATLEESADGGAVAMSGAQELLRVMPPIAIDANGNNVPAALEVSGDSLVLSAATDESTAFPVLLDPVVVESWEWNALKGNQGLGGSNGAWPGIWTSWRNTLAYGADPYVPWATPPSPLYKNLPGLTVTSGWQSSVAVGAQANWNYYVPRYFSDYEKYGTRPTSFIQNMQMWNLQYHAYSGQASPWLAVGLWDENLTKWVSVYSRNGTEGSIGEKYWTYLYNFPNPSSVQSAKNAGFGLLSSEAGANNGRILYAGYAAVSLNDLTKPSIGSYAGPAKWQNNTAAEALTVNTTDTGLGMKYVRLVGEKAGENYLTQLYCLGSATDPCYRNWNSTWKGYPVAELSTGIHYYTATAIDVLGNESATAKVPVKIDHTAPSLALSGTMTQQASLGYARPQYVLHLEGSDGTSGAPQAGIASSEVTVDGKVVDTTKAGCATQNCSLSRDWTLKSEAYSAGEHKVVASVTDGAGNTTTKSLTIKIEADTIAPTLETGGTLVTAPEGWVEQVSRTATAYAEDVKGYGVTSLTFSIDGKVVKSGSQSCQAGGCQQELGVSVNMAGYAGGAHSAEVVAKDGAGNISKDAWTVNVNPSGSISSSEVTDTLEAVDETSEPILVAPTNEVVDPAEIEAGNDPALAIDGSNLVSTGTGADSSMTPDAGSGFTIDTGDETYHIEPTTNTTSETNLEVANKVAGVAANTASGVDTVIRPIYDGIMEFQSIRTSTAPEAYSWKVQLHQEQALKLIDEQHAGIYNADETLGLTVTAEIAHDATGKSVPTSLSVSEGNVLTLTVDHQGGGFVYPVVAGPAWQTGYETIIVPGPPTKQQEEQEEAAILWTLEASTIYGQISAPEPVGTGDDFDATASKVPTYRKRFNFRQCSEGDIFGIPNPLHPDCSDWEQYIAGHFFYNNRYAWWKDSQARPTCPHETGIGYAVDTYFCDFVGFNHQKYGGGYHITAQVFFDAIFVAKGPLTKSHISTVRMFGSGGVYFHPDEKCICNPSV